MHTRSDIATVRTEALREARGMYSYWSFGFRAGSFDKNPKINNETKNVITVYTKIFKVTIRFEVFDEKMK